MPTVSESLAKLSVSAAELSKRAKELEDHATTARNDTRETLEARAAEARAIAQRQRDDLTKFAGEMKDDLASMWAALESSVQDLYEKARARLDERRNDRNAETAERRAEMAEAYAAGAVEFAKYATAEADAAVLDAHEARSAAEGLTTSTSAAG